MDRDVEEETAPLLRPHHERSTSGEHGDGAGGGRFRWHPSHYVIVISALRNFGQWAILANLMEFLAYRRLLKWSTFTTGVLALLAANVPYVLAAATGALTDTTLSCFAMLFAGILLEFVGSSVMLGCAFALYYYHEASKDVPTPDEHTLRIFIPLGLLLYVLGVAASKGAEIPLGMEQYWRREEPLSTAKGFFPCYYWWLNASVSVSVGLLSFVQLNYGFHIGFIPAVVAYFTALLSLYRQRKTLHYSRREENSAGLKKVLLVYREAVRVWWKLRGEGRRRAGSVLWREVESGQSRFVEDDVSSARNLLNLAAVLLSTLCFYLLLAQTYTVYTIQGEHMAYPIHHNRTHRSGIPYLPPQLIADTSGLTILVMIPLLYGIIYPQFERSTWRWRLTIFTRIGIGMFFAVLSLVSATVVEYQRRELGRWNQTFQFDSEFKHTYEASSLLIFWQIPQFVLSGISETLVLLSVLEFAYSKSPLLLKGTSIGLVSCLKGFAGLLSALLLFILAKTEPDVFYRPGQRGQMHYYFAALGCVVLAGIIVFAFAARRYVYIYRVGRVS